jgi:hypothetical protein
VVPLVGCGETAGGGGGSAGAGGSAGIGGVGGDGGQAGEGGSAGDGGIAPEIVFIGWYWADPCDINASGQGLVVQIYAVVDGSLAGPEDQLTYSGQVQDCTGDLNAFETTLTCEVYLGARQSEATVTDPQGNEDSMFFAPEPCTSDCEPGCPGKE